MKGLKALVTILFLLLPTILCASVSVNLTPVPKEMTVQEGQLLLPQEIKINTGNLTEEMNAEVQNFATVLQTTTGYTVIMGNDANALIQINKGTTHTQNPEGYYLQVSGQRVTVEASTATGLFYAFQSIKKMLPANVMAGKTDAAVTEYALPLVTITDEPRFGYRGYMLDVSRHFFTVDEVKRMLDVMSYYKMNRFHWHLTDDQGWRIEIKKYPKLTEIGSIRDKNIIINENGQREVITGDYGPYFYTQEQLKEVVAYAKKLHIEIIPEVDMPGHFTAAMKAYPEYSCFPDKDPVIPHDGGVYNDILNVANEGAVQFAKDILDELIDIFPYPYLHIGGDECPTTSWEQNAECQQLVATPEYGGNYRKLQSHFIKKLADHIAPKGYKLFVWNEAITAGNADVSLIQETGATVMCWTGAEAAADKAATLGMNNVLTPQPTYYINRRQSTDPSEPSGFAGSGSETLKAVYNYAPANNVSAGKLPYYTGIQGTFWTEYVHNNYYLEYQTFPRLIAIAESAWSPAAKKDFNNFCQRMIQDKKLLDYNQYAYATYYLNEDPMSMPIASKNGASIWYRIVTRCTADTNRKGRCIELLREGAPQLSNSTAKVNMLWNGTAAASASPAYDYQLWALKADPNGSGKYALVCKAKPNGSVNPTATAGNNTARWMYDENQMHYNFELSDLNFYGKADGFYYYGIHSDQYGKEWMMNMAGSGQQYSINMWNNDNDAQDANRWSFQPAESFAVQGVVTDLSQLQDGDLVVFQNVNNNNGAADRQGYMYYTEDEFLKKLDGAYKTSLSFMKQSFAPEYVFQVSIQDGQYQFRNVKGQAYLPNNAVNNGAYVPTPETKNTTFTIASSEKVPNTWAIQSTANNLYLNGITDKPVAYTGYHSYNLIRVGNHASASAAPVWFSIGTLQPECGRTERRLRVGGCEGDAENILWMSDAYSTTDNLQQWTIEENPLSADHFALVCKAYPSSSAKSAPVSGSVASARFGYQTEEAVKDYGFYVANDENSPIYDMDRFMLYREGGNADNLFINHSAAGQNYHFHEYDTKDYTKSYLWSAIITASLNDAGEPGPLGSFSAPFKVQLPQGVTAYVATESNQDAVLLKAYDGTVLPANTPVILKGGQAGMVQMLQTDAAVDGTDITVNLLEGTGSYRLLTPQRTCYVLGKPEGQEAGMYRYTGETLPPFRAYLPNSSGSTQQIKTFIFDGETTGIQTLPAPENGQDAPVYDLSGRRVSNLKPGIYIRNHQKFTVH